MKRQQLSDPQPLQGGSAYLAAYLARKDQLSLQPLSQEGREAKLLCGKTLSLQLRSLLKESLAEIEAASQGAQVQANLSPSIRMPATEARTFRKPGLAVIQVGQDPASSVYVRNKRLACEKLGMQSFYYQLQEEEGEQALWSLIDTLNEDEAVDGILCQLPLPAGWSSQAALNRISPAKDVDGLHPENQGLLFTGEQSLDRGFLPCTPKGIMSLLKAYGIELEGRRALVVGRSLLVGKPIAQLLLAENMTVTQAHSRSQNLPKLCAEADVLVLAMGRAEAIQPTWLKPAAVVVDVGINRVEEDEHGQAASQPSTGSASVSGPTDQAAAVSAPSVRPSYRLVGDFAAAHIVKEQALLYTPVPGGVGPMTIASLLENCFLSYLRRETRRERQAAAKPLSAEDARA